MLAEIERIREASKTYLGGDWGRLEGRRGELGRGTVDADGPVGLARQDTGVPIISVRDVTTVPSKGNTAVGSSDQVRVSATSVGISHVVQHGDAERLGVTSSTCSGKAEHGRRGSAVACSKLADGSNA